MKVLILGSGGREHALVRALKSSNSVREVHVAPGNDGMKSDATVHNINLNNTQALSKIFKELKFELVVIGPDQALADGLSDFFRSLGAKVFGPSLEGAKLEWSKSFAKDFMTAAKIPTAPYFVVNNVADVEKALEKFSAPWVLKADGLALGKGVYICATPEELGHAAEEIFVEKKFGEAGRIALVEEFKPGWEISVHVITDGVNYQILPYAQDNKRLLDGNKGPNTGGMGTVAPIPVRAELREKIETQIVIPAIEEIKRRKFLYRGVLFIGIMICDDEPLVLEFNSRFGDPEAQVFMPLLDGDWGQIFKDVAEGRCPSMKWKDLFATCVVLAAPGYPDAPKKGVVIKGELKTSSEKYFLHAGICNVNGQFVTSGGRVLNAVGLGNTLAKAQSRAYELVRSINHTDFVYRTDIGSQFT